jgi:hypothetical protein
LRFIDGCRHSTWRNCIFCVWCWCHCCGVLKLRCRSYWYLYLIKRENVYAVRYKGYVTYLLILGLVVW